MVIQIEDTLQADYVLSACDGEKSRMAEIVINFDHLVSVPVFDDCKYQLC